jgi:hypothetical protein
VAQFNTPAALLEAQTRRGPFKPIPGTPIDHAMRTKRAIICSRCLKLCSRMLSEFATPNSAILRCWKVTAFGLLHSMERPETIVMHDNANPSFAGTPGAI